MLVAFVHIGLFHALRNPYIFPDNAGYAQSFLYIHNMPIKEALFSVYSFEWGTGFIFLQWLIGRFTHEPQVMFMCLSFFYIACVFWAIFKGSRLPIVSIVVFMVYPLMFYQSQYVLRQHIAAGVIMLFLYYIENYKISIPLCLVAITLHPSAIVIVPFYFFRKIKFSTIFSFKFIPLFLLLLFVVNSSLRVIYQYSERYSTYAEEEGGSNIVPLSLIGLLIIYHFFQGNYKRNISEKDKTILSYLLYGFMITISLTGVNGSGRLTNYFIYGIVGGLPLVYRYGGKNENIHIIFTIFYVAILSMFFINLEKVEYQMFFK